MNDNGFYIMVHCLRVSMHWRWSPNAPYKWCCKFLCILLSCGSCPYSTIFIHLVGFGFGHHEPRLAFRLTWTKAAQGDAETQTSTLQPSVSISNTPSGDKCSHTIRLVSEFHAAWRRHFVSVCQHLFPLYPVLPSSAPESLLLLRHKLCPFTLPPSRSSRADSTRSKRVEDGWSIANLPCPAAYVWHSGMRFQPQFSCLWHAAHQE